MSERDPIDELTRFGTGLNATPGGDMPLSAAQVRRRGDQIRRRRNTWVAVGSALAVAAVAVPIFAVVGGDRGSDSSLVTKDPTSPSAPAVVASLGVDDLLSAEDTEFGVNEPTPWVVIDTYEGDGQAAFHVCQRETLSSLGASGSFTRFFDWGGTEPVAGTGLSETIAEFADEGAARAAYDQVRLWLQDCDGHVPQAERTSVFGPRNVDAAGGDRSGVYDISWGPVPTALDEFGGDGGFINETGLVQVGNRISVLSLTLIGMDYNWLDEDGGTPVHRMLPKAAEKLVRP